MTRPSGSWTSAPSSSPPSCGRSASSVPSPPSATGQRSGGIRPARSSPRPIAPATSAARNVPLKESGATRTGRSFTGMARILARRLTRDRSNGHLIDVATESFQLEGVQAAVGTLSPKWSVAVLAQLAGGTAGFGELTRRIGVSRRVVAAPPRALGGGGGVERPVDARVPGRGAYDPSPPGAGRVAPP